MATAALLHRRPEYRFRDVDIVDATYTWEGDPELIVDYWEIA